MTSDTALDTRLRYDSWGDHHDRRGTSEDARVWARDTCGKVLFQRVRLRLPMELSLSMILGVLGNQQGNMAYRPD